MWLGVCGGIPRPPKNPSKRKKGGGGEREDLIMGTK